MSLLPSNINTKPIFSDQQIIFGLENKSLLYVNPLNGALTKERNKSFLSSGNLIKQSDIIITTDNNGSIYALDAERNKTYWKAKTGGRIISTALWNENILVSSNDNFVYLISLKNGNKRWKVRTGGRIIGNVILDSNRAVYISGGSNTALILDLNLGKIVNRITIKEDENFISSPLLINKRLIIPTQKAIYSFSPEC
jgi:outer membrane protein assembly factor BamB